ncbi:MAG: 4-hydroxy-tetrahydrodipicolinate synthase [Verrucomicrobia bacterium]|nr:4-hydroxy-tetrahydrodipicolinate synthase [Verrucomicrobiota bacterium]
MREPSMFEGTYTALVTPFRNGQVDVKAFEELIERQVAEGIEGIVPVGTTGESPTLSMQEHLRVIELAVQFAKKRTKVVAGTGSNSTAEAIELSAGAQRANADALLQVAPYYNKPSSEGMFQHFRAIAKAVNLPIMLYSVPGRCVVEIAVETIGRLAQECPTIRAIKEAGGKAERVDAIRKVVPADFEVTSGDDGMTVEFMKRGAVGVVSVASNLMPAEVKALVDAARRKDWKKAAELHAKYAAVFRDLFIESNPGPVKAAMAAKGWLAEELRLPLVPITEANRQKLFATLQEAGLR